MPAKGKEKIIDAALALFAERGFDAVSIRDIGERAGLTNPALYQHYKGKYALGLDVYRRCYAALQEAVERRLEPGQDALQKVDAYIDGAAALHGETPSPLLLIEKQISLFGPPLREEYGDKAITRRFEAWIAEGRKDGLIRSDVPAAMLTGMVLGQMTLWAIQSDMGIAPRRGAVAAMKKLARAALAPPA